MNIDGTYGDGRSAMISTLAGIIGAGKVALIGDAFTECLSMGWNMLNGRQFHNLGYGGALVEDLVEQLPVVLPSVLPSRAIIMIGFADAYGAWDSSAFQTDYTNVINQLKAYTSNIFLSTIPPPANQGTPPSLSPISTVNAIIATIASANSVGLIDSYTAFVGGGGYAQSGYTAADGVNPSLAGIAALLPLYTSAAGGSLSSTSWTTGQFQVTDAFSDCYLTYGSGQFYIVNNRNTSSIQVYSATSGRSFRGSQMIAAGQAGMFSTAVPADNIYRRFLMD